MSSTSRTLLRALVGGLAVASLALTGCSPSTEAVASDIGGDSSSSERETVTITDEVGREVEIEVPIQKIYYSTNVYGPELVRGIGAGDTIVAVTTDVLPENSPSNAAYLESFKTAVDAGTHEEVNYEAIVASGAEVAFFYRNAPWEEAAELLEPFGIEVVVLTAWDPLVIREYLPTLGRLFDKEEEAAELATLYDDIDATIEAGIEGAAEKSFYYENGNDYVTGVPGSGWHDIIVKAGGVNLYGDVNIGDDSSASVHSYTVDPVDIISRNPDIIIRNGIDGANSGITLYTDADVQEALDAIVTRSGWSGVSAVQSGEVYAVNNYFYSAFGKQYGALINAALVAPGQFDDDELNELWGRWLDAQGIERSSVWDYVHQHSGS